MKLSALALGAMLSVSALVGVAYAANPDVGGAAMFEDKNIIENAVNSADHTTLVAAVKACCRKSYLWDRRIMFRTVM